MLYVLILSVTLFCQAVRCYNIPHFILLYHKVHHFLVNSNSKVEAAAETFSESIIENGWSLGPFLYIATMKSESCSR